MVNTVVEVEMQHPRLLIIEAFESRLYSGPEKVATAVVNTVVEMKIQQPRLSFLFSGHEPIYFTENKEKTLRVSYDRDTHTIEYMN